ncbi:ABC transporter substrate-binding protein [Luteolibacter pohnpeiensis]|uniref:ABC transporter substrate-binding protein n=1 Tax=Luteolibacter pohnpeiensis TaxID=454153 RepID=A0A934VV08_9BACT|nr:ABC transporter substrate-binding protein [Luteolibacter pohnpeiensis]MBK1883087.1 ABC transporter substrate-binding protein [Luteolibacter pohnpeiensis]
MSLKLKQILCIAAIALVALAGLTTLLINRGEGDAPWRTKDRGMSASGYDVDLSPTGKVHFDRVPERVVTMDANYNDMLVALGEDRKLVATGYQDNDYDGFYHALSGYQPADRQHALTYLSTPGGGMFDKELLYALRADVHHIDPLQLAASRGWSERDVDEIAANVGPFLANRYSRDHHYPGAEPYEYYDLWSLSEKIGEVYQRTGAIQLLKQVGDRMVASIQAKLPPESERPRVGLVYYNNGKYTIYSLANEGFGQVQYRELGVRDAFASIADRAYGGSQGPVGTPLDAEGLLSMNPDVLIMPFAINSGSAAMNFERMQALKDDPLLGRVNAFKNGRVYPGGTPLQGPIFYLFQLEMAAKQIYPTLFGEFRKDHLYPKSEQLFDRDEVVRILKKQTELDHAKQ